jgi:drug/metabolite transporter (DMT)-like permease
LAWRFSVAAGCLWLFLFVAGRAKAGPGVFRRVFLLGLFGFSPQAGLYFFTVRVLDPGIASLLLYLYPAFVAVFSAIFLKSPPGAFRVVALAVALSGCAMVFWQPGTYPAEGIALGIALAVAYAAYLVAAQKTLAGTDSVYATATLMLAAAIAYWIASLATGSARFPATANDWLGIVGLAVVASILPIVTLFAAIRAIGAETASLVSTIEPVFTIALSAAILEERFGPAQLAGGAVVLAAVFAISFKEWKDSRQAGSPAREGGVSA